ncbi:hypothetical protein [Streptomyces erythrochromogenes]|uniref:hypothetical protein n=1 Tax=Streptomyces erythrochromogenes TaxID=285574 RepID=UPI0002DFF2D3
MSTRAQVREIVRPGSAFIALWSGSVVLAGLVCRCGGRALGWAWDVASVDAEATEAAQAKADKAARAKAAKAKAKARKAAKADQDDDAEDGDDDQEPEDDSTVTAPAVKPVRRPVPESLGLAAFGGLLASGAAGTTATLIWPYAQQLGPYQGVLATAGGLGWAVAAWMLAPAPAPAEDHDQEPDAEAQQAEVEDAEAAEAPDRGTALLLHVVGALAEAEAVGRVGLHLDVVLASAVAAGLLAEGTEQGEFRTWVEGCGLPTADKVGYRIGGKPVTRVGLRIDAATAALGMSPAALLRARVQAPVTAPGETPAAAAVAPTQVPAQGVGERAAEALAGTPAEAPSPAPAGTPAPAVLRLIPGGLLDPDSAPSPALSKGRAQEAR